MRIASAPSYSEMVHAIMTNDAVYTFLIYFYLDEISDWQFEQEMKFAAEKGITERQYLSRYFASRIPGEDCYEKLIAIIKEIAAEP